MKIMQINIENIFSKLSIVVKKNIQSLYNLQSSIWIASLKIRV